MEFCDNSTTYIIPFDSVDLSLLSPLNVIPKFQENIKPIWDTNNLQQRNEDCYYEFEIVQKEESSDCTTYCSSTVSDCSSYMEADVLDPSLSTDESCEMCYICNIEVPSVCMSEHQASAKHKTFLKIAEISLERVRKQMGTNYKNKDLPVGFSFCDICVALVPEGDMVSHKKLKPHKNAELIDKLLLNLLKIYLETEVGDDDESMNTSKFGSKSSRDSGKVDTVDGIRRKVVSSKIYNGSVKSSEVASSKIVTGDKLDVNAAKITTGHRFNPDSADTIAGDGKLNLDKGKTIKSSVNLEVNSPKNSKVNGKLDAYTAKATTSDGKFGNVTENDNVANDKSNKNKTSIDTLENIEVDKILKEEFTKKKALKRIVGNKDFNRRIVNNIDGDMNDYLRKLDNSNYKVEVGEENDLVIKTQSGLRVRVTLANFHGLYVLGKRHMLCILCKKVERDIGRHIYSNDHLNNIRLAIDENCIRKLDNEKSHCIICNDAIEYPGVHALCNKEHDAMLKMSLVDGEIDKLEKSSSSTQKPPITEKIKLQENPVGKNKEVINKDPVATRFYSEAVKEWNTSVEIHNVDAVVVSDSPEEICKVCYSSYHPANWEAHNQSTEHKSNEALIPHHLLEYSNTHRTLKCKVCTTGFPVQCKIQHISSPVHQNNYRKLLAVNNMTRNGRMVYCNTCVESIEIGDELTHLTSAKHKAAVMNTLSSKGLEKSEGGEKGSSQPHYCQVCLTNVPGDMKSVKTHEKGARHTKNLALAAAKTKGKNTEKVQDKVSPVLPVEYRHAIRATTKPSEVLCRICSSLIPNTVNNISQHLEGASHKNNLTSLEKSSIKLYRDIYWCNTCDMQVPIGEQFLHKDSTQHTDKITQHGTDEEKAEKSTVKAPNGINSFYLNMLKPTENKGTVCCQVCNVVVPNSGSTLRMHFDGVKHRTQLMKLLKSNGLSGMGLIGEFNCTICLYRFPTDNLLDHIERPRHVAGLGAPTPAEGKPQPDQKNQEAKTKSDVKNQEINLSKAKDDNKANLESKSVQKDQEEAKVKSEQNPENAKAKLEDRPCVVCDVMLTSNEANIATHVDGARHKTNLKMMEDNRVRVLDKGCYCDACDINVARDNLLQHLAAPQHLVMLG